MVAHQALLSMGFSRQEYWSGLLCPPSEDLPYPGTETASPVSPALTCGFFTTSTTWEAHRRQPTRLPRPWDSLGKNTGVGCHFLFQCMNVKVKVKSLSCVRLLATPWTAAYQAPPSMGFSRQEYWSGVPLPSPKA